MADLCTYLWLLRNFLRFATTCCKQDAIDAELHNHNMKWTVEYRIKLMNSYKAVTICRENHITERTEDNGIWFPCLRAVAFYFAIVNVLLTMILLSYVLC